MKYKKRRLQRLHLTTAFGGASPQGEAYARQRSPKAFPFEGKGDRLRWMRCLPRQSGGLESIIFVSIDMYTTNAFALMPRGHLLLSCATKGGKNALNAPPVPSPVLKTRMLSTPLQRPLENHIRQEEILNRQHEGQTAEKRRLRRPEVSVQLFPPPV